MMEHIFHLGMSLGLYGTLKWLRLVLILSVSTSELHNVDWRIKSVAVRRRCR